MLELVFNAFVTLVVVVIDPLGLAPLFVALRRGRTRAYKREAAIRGTALGAAILFVFAFVGQGLLDALGIGVSAFRIAGGALLFLLSLDMVFARSSGMRRATSREQEEITEVQEEISAFPLTIPFIAGPGSLTTVLLYTDGDFWTTAAVMVVLLVVLLLTLASLLLAPRAWSSSARPAQTCSPGSSASSSRPWQSSSSSTASKRALPCSRSARGPTG